MQGEKNACGAYRGHLEMVAGVAEGQSKVVKIMRRERELPRQTLRGRVVGMLYQDGGHDKKK